MNSESSIDKSFIPVTLVTLSVIIFFVWQLKNISKQREDLQSAKGKLEELYQTNIPKLDDQVQKSKQIQAGLEKLVLDLLDLAKTDTDARTIVDKYKIEQHNPTAPAGSATPAR
jgi:hypothetical protein